MKALIIEDESLIAKALKGKIETVATDVEVIDILSSLKTSKKWFMQNAEPDLIFMDIQLCDGVSFELFDTYKLNCPVIFTTAYDEYALKAFEVNALDYLLKPVEPRRLADAVEKLRRSATNGSGEKAINHSEPTSILSETDQVFVKDGERCWFVKLSEVRLFESVGNYAKVFFGSNKPLILKSLNALEERLDDKVFFRANRKHIVNLRLIDKIEPYFNGGLLLELKGGEKIEVSRRQTVKFKEMMSL